VWWRREILRVAQNDKGSEWNAKGIIKRDGLPTNRLMMGEVGYRASLDGTARKVCIKIPATFFETLILPRST
jgi:hypothetical protein